ncbi:MAG: hypothetical protein AAGG44_00370 [Planctomycetota bacterium]
MRRRAYRGWLAATTTAVTLSLVFLVVVKHSNLAKPLQIVTPSRHDKVASTQPKGIVLELDPELVAEVEATPVLAEAPAARTTVAEVEHEVADWMQQPPEPAPNVTLMTPIATFESSDLPLHSDGKGVNYLMEAMDEAFQKPARVASALRSPPVKSTYSIPSESSSETTVAPAEQQLVGLNSEVPAPVTIQPKLPRPNALLSSLANLQYQLDPSTSAFHDRLVKRQNTLNLVPAEAARVQAWIASAQQQLDRITGEIGLEHANSVAELESLRLIASEATTIGESLADYQVAATLIRLGYSISKRIAVWDAIRAGLDGTSIGLSGARDPMLARQQLRDSIDQVANLLGSTPDARAWNDFLQLDALREWANTSQWAPVSGVAESVIERLHWPSLGRSQRTFLARPEFQELAANLVAWGREPVNYRDLLTSIETIEADPINRESVQLARSVQALRLTGGSEGVVASTINNHYRNANLRLSVSGDLLQRFLPSAQYEVRPVRQRILGADTRGNSAVQTELQLGLIPDNGAWNVRIGVLGDMYSNTQSSRGPATFHNTSTAQINSQRYIRLDRSGYEISSQPTNVASNDYLRKMSTDYDALPVIGDFVRLLVREQFNQKRGLAQRITRRIIAQEADVELDRRLQESLATAEEQLENRIIGPLEQLNLNPMVVSLGTTEKRLTVRYRVGNESQLAAHTPRPRAPGDSLMSMQLHESSINNALSQLGLSGRTWNVADLYQHLGTILQQEAWTLPEDVPDDIQIRFADTRPATVEMRDGKLRLTLRIALLRQESSRLNIERFLVHSNYIPVASGLDAQLVRDGVVEIVSPRNRLALRLIFAKVFVSRPRIALISERWQEDERSENLAVSQLEINEGWLAVALGEEGSGHSEEVAARAQQLLK